MNLISDDVEIGVCGRRVTGSPIYFVNKYVPLLVNPDVYTQFVQFLVV